MPRRSARCRSPPGRRTSGAGGAHQPSVGCPHTRTGVLPVLPRPHEGIPMRPARPPPPASCSSRSPAAGMRRIAARSSLPRSETAPRRCWWGTSASPRSRRAPHPRASRPSPPARSRTSRPTTGPRAASSGGRTARRAARCSSRTSCPARARPRRRRSSRSAGVCSSRRRTARAARSSGGATRPASGSCATSGRGAAGRPRGTSRSPRTGRSRSSPPRRRCRALEDRRVRLHSIGAADAAAQPVGPDETITEASLLTHGAVAPHAVRGCGRGGPLLPRRGGGRREPGTRGGSPRRTRPSPARARAGRTPRARGRPPRRGRARARRGCGRAPACPGGSGRASPGSSGAPTRP